MTEENRDSFVHLHVHSQYSILDGAAKISDLVKKAVDDKMPAIALTDHGSMFGIKDFHVQCLKGGIKPILGCETYVARRGHTIKSDSKLDGYGSHLVLLAKNEVGYHNLVRLISIASIDGVYYKPRIDKELLAQYKEGLIVLSACLGGEIPKCIENDNVEGAEKVVQWYKEEFGDDFYLEIQQHPTEDYRLKDNVYKKQLNLIVELSRISKKYDVKLVATNDVHFTNEDDAEPHDLLVCLSTGKDFHDENRMRYTKQEWFKSTEEMYELFKEYPDALANTVEIANKVEEYKLDKDPIMPEFPIPEEFGTMEGYRKKITKSDLSAIWGEEKLAKDGAYEAYLRTYFESDYLKHLVFKGAETRYGSPLEESVKSRLDFELETIQSMGFPGYFLIVQDFIAEAREMGVLVGPGRGSAAGSAVAYCTHITDVDPIAFDLLFERFLNPDRVSMPDIDIDFDDDGRQLVLDKVTAKYGIDKVAHISTFGKMACKSAIKDVARVLDLPLPEANRLAGLVPDQIPNVKKVTVAAAIEHKTELGKEATSSNPVVAKTVNFAARLEGSIRQTGVHACGVLIGKDALSENIPLKREKDTKLLITQYDGHFVEDIGLLKMDFLGLKTLTIIKEALRNMEISKDVKMTMEEIPLDDPKTYELFTKGETTAIFQFESPGMKKYLKMLEPDRLNDLVAMNALYRPGPMEYIPDYINRKHGRTPVEYDVPMMAKYLEETNGITVFQEQVMLLSRHLAGFTRGESDTLRKAMGKKIEKLMDQLRVIFFDGCKANEQFVSECKEKGADVTAVIEKIWSDWAKFASYAFNKSHSVCYAILACKTGYLKANYPSEFMASVLSSNLNNPDKMSSYMEECKGYMKLSILGPDINESYDTFTVNKKGQIRFGIKGIKGVGEAAVSLLISEREKNGPFVDIFDFIKRMQNGTISKKNIESMGQAGVFDSFPGVDRALFIDKVGEESFLEILVRFGQQLKSEQSQTMGSLFGDSGIDLIEYPQIPERPNVTVMEILEKERELTGLYLSGHPLDPFRLEINAFCKEGVGLEILTRDIDSCEDKDLTFAGRIEESTHGTTKNGKPFASIVVADYTGKHKFFFMGQTLKRYESLLTLGNSILLKGKAERNHYRSSQVEFVPNFIASLAGIISRIAELTITIDLNILSDEVITYLHDLIVKNSGTSSLRFQLLDPKSDGEVALASRTYKVNVNREMLKDLNGIDGIKFQVN